MTERTFAFVDESGDPNLEVQKEGVSSHYVVVAVVLKKEQLDTAKGIVRKVRAEHFSGAEIKSSSVGPNYERRLRILADFANAPWRYVVFVADKAEIFRDSGLRFKQVFIKHLNGKVYAKLFSAYPVLSVYADQHGRSEFMESVKRYVEARCVPDFFEESTFEFVDSETTEMVQVADFVAGSLAKVFAHETAPFTELILSSIRPMVMSFDEWPLSMRGPAESLAQVSDDRYDFLVRSYCRQMVESYMSNFDGSDHEDARLRSTVLSILFDELKYGDPDRYVSGPEIQSRLAELGFEAISSTKLQTGVISHFRDNGVILGSGNQGYKIPTRLADIHSYVEHCQSVIAPMKNRLHHARTNILTTSHAELDIVADDRFAFIKELLDKLSPLSGSNGSSA